VTRNVTWLSPATRGPGKPAHYLLIAYAGVTLFHLSREPITLPEPRPDVTPGRLADHIVTNLRVLACGLNQVG
jgi:hypothetical protein